MFNLFFTEIYLKTSKGYVESQSFQEVKTFKIKKKSAHVTVQVFPIVLYSLLP